MQSRLLTTILWIACWKVSVSNASPTVNFWTCPNLHGPDAVSCTCELAHALQCRGTYSQEGLQKIVSLLRSLPVNNTVQVLDLKLHNLTIIPEDSFRDVNLHAMIISSMDSLTLLPNSFRGLEGFLVALGLPANSLREIPTRALQVLALLEKMDFSDNQLTSLTANDLAPFSRLEDLNLSNNNITTIDDYAFKNNKKLRKLILDGNKLSDPLFSWSKTIYDGLPLLENLSLVRTDLTDSLIKQRLPKLPGLTSLNLSFNNLTGVHFRSFIDLPKLQFLDISYNQLSFLDKEAFQGLTSLLKLDLSHNHLTELAQESFVGLISLTSLMINDNYLTVITQSAFDEMKTIRSINARDNEINYIHPTAFSQATFLESLDLQDNNLPCSCKMKGFAMWLKTKSSPLTLTCKRQILCETPLGTSRLMMEMKPYEFSCSNETPVESLAKIKEEESGHFSSVSSIRLQLVDFVYNQEKKSLVLVWDIDSQAQPYECDAVFIFEKIDRKDEIRQKVPIFCDSNAEVNPRQLTMPMTGIDLRQANIYRFCIVLFGTNKALIPGCSELLQVSGNRLTSLTAAQPIIDGVPLPTEIVDNRIVSSGFPSIHVNLTPSSPDAVTVWWTFNPELTTTDLCVLNVSLLTSSGQVAADRVLQCSKRSVNFSDVDPTDTYKVCIKVLEPNTFYRENNCVILGVGRNYHMTPVTSNPVITTALTGVFIGLAVILLIAVFVTARRMFWPSKKSISLISASNEYRVLYHQPEDASSHNTSDVAQLTREV